VFPSGLNASSFTLPISPRKDDFSWPDLLSWNRMIGSAQAVASVLPSGLKTTSRALRVLAS
jgi:hypothetical protein